MIATFADELARLITTKLNEWLDKVVQERLEHNDRTPSPPMVIYLGDGFSANVNFSDVKPYIYVYVQRIRCKPFTFGSNEGTVNINIVVNDNVCRNVMEVIDNVYKFVGATIESLNEKWKGKAEVVLMNDLITYFDSKERELVFRYVIEVPVKIIVKNVSGEL